MLECLVGDKRKSDNIHIVKKHMYVIIHGGMDVTVGPISGDG
jgi:hypothetical protein